MTANTTERHKIIIIEGGKVLASFPQADKEVPLWFHGSYDEETFAEVEDFCKGLIRFRPAECRADISDLSGLQAVVVVYTCDRCGKEFIDDELCWYRSEDLHARRAEFLNIIKEEDPNIEGFSDCYNPRNYYDWHRSGCLGAYLCESCQEKFDKSGLDIVGFLEGTDRYLSTLYRFPYFVVAEINSVGNAFSVYTKENAANKAFTEKALKIAKASGNEILTKMLKNGSLEENYIRVDNSRMYVREFSSTAFDVESMYLIVGYDEDDRIVHLSGYEKESTAKASLCDLFRKTATAYGDEKKQAPNNSILAALDEGDLIVEDADGKSIAFNIYKASVLS